jgi:ubiquinone/menaquinone biosynthesis C-methylase UbiE
MGGGEPVPGVLRTKEEARRNYDRLSSWYDLFSGSGEFKLAIATLDRMKLPEGSTILEVGFGTGKLLLEIIRRVGKNGCVYGVDLSPGMCRFTGRRLRKACILDRALLITGDGYRLPITSGSMDGIFMGFTLELFDTPELLPVIRECMRVLKPGGQLGIVYLAASKRPGFIEQLYMEAHEHWPRLVDCRPIDPIPLLITTGFSSSECVFTKLWGLPVTQLVFIKQR